MANVINWLVGTATANGTIGPAFFPVTPKLVTIWVDGAGSDFDAVVQIEVTDETSDPSIRWQELGLALTEPGRREISAGFGGVRAIVTDYVSGTINVRVIA